MCSFVHLDTSQKFGKWQFCRFSCRNFSQFCRLWRSPKLGPDFGDTPDQARSDPINRDRPRPDPIRPDRESILAMLPIEDPILVMPRSATMPKKDALLLCRVAQMKPDNGKDEYYYVSYSY
jgi:hypothetical protein